MATRKAPADSATLYAVGTKKRGIDTKQWVVALTAAGVKRWKSVAPLGRKGPRDSATLHAVGTAKRGADGKQWVVARAVSGVKRWRRVPAAAAAAKKAPAKIPLSADRMPAGEYYVGDLSHVLLTKEWRALVRDIDMKRQMWPPYHLPDGRLIQLLRTYRSVGVYRDQHGGRYAVKKGNIGVIRIADVSVSPHMLERARALGQVRRFPRAFKCENSRRPWGILRFGTLRINTRPVRHRTMVGNTSL